MESDAPIRLDRRLWIWSVVAGASYGLFARLMAGLHSTGQVFQVMSASFIFGVPLVLGFISIWVLESRRRQKWWKWIVAPWPGGLLFLLGALALVWEGIVCIVIWLPLVLILSTIGGVAAGLLRLLWLGPGSKIQCVTVAALLPFAAAPLENLRSAASEIRTVRTHIDIHGDRAAVWAQIRSVSKIAPSENDFSLSHLLGFPLPLEAKLEGVGVGAVRHATFEGGVLFVETVTEWEEDRALGFSIKADTKNIPPTTFDEHVTIGGPYFDVLDGRYEIEELGTGWVRLHLSSRQRLSIHFNFYSHLWTEWLMADLQNHILRIVRRRAEVVPR